MKTLLDLFCGLGGWSEGFKAEGWRTVGVDIADFKREYPGEFVQADVLLWSGWLTLQPDAVVASPPCEEFSRFQMPWTRKRNPPEPDLTLICRTITIAHTLRVPLVLENVQAAQGWLGRSQMNCGPFHLWGDVPALIPTFQGRRKESYDSRERAQRAKVPIELARHVARCLNS